MAVSTEKCLDGKNIPNMQVYGKMGVPASDFSLCSACVSEHFLDTKLRYELVAFKEEFSICKCNFLDPKFFDHFPSFKIGAAEKLIVSSNRDPIPLVDSNGCPGNNYIYGLKFYNYGSGWDDLVCETCINKYIKGTPEETNFKWNGVNGGKCNIKDYQNKYNVKQKVNRRNFVSEYCEGEEFSYKRGRTWWKNDGLTICSHCHNNLDNQISEYYQPKVEGNEGGKCQYPEHFRRIATVCEKKCPGNKPVKDAKCYSYPSIGTFECTVCPLHMNQITKSGRGKGYKLHPPNPEFWWVCRYDEYINLINKEEPIPTTIPVPPPLPNSEVISAPLLSSSIVGKQLPSSDKPVMENCCLGEAFVSRPGTVWWKIGSLTLCNHCYNKLDVNEASKCSPDIEEEHQLGRCQNSQYLKLLSFNKAIADGDKCPEYAKITNVVCYTLPHRLVNYGSCTICPFHMKEIINSGRGKDYITYKADNSIQWICQYDKYFNVIERDIPAIPETVESADVSIPVPPVVLESETSIPAPPAPVPVIFSSATSGVVFSEIPSSISAPASASIPLPQPFASPRQQIKTKKEFAALNTDQLCAWIRTIVPELDTSILQNQQERGAGFSIFFTGKNSDNAVSNLEIEFKWPRGLARVIVFKYLQLENECSN